MDNPTGAIPKTKPKVAQQSPVDLAAFADGKPTLQYSQLTGQQLGSSSARAAISATGPLLMEDGNVLMPNGRFQQLETDQHRQVVSVPDSPTLPPLPNLDDEDGIGDTSDNEIFQSDAEVTTDTDISLTSTDKYLIQADQEFEAQLTGLTLQDEDLIPSDRVIRTRRMLDGDTGHVIMLPEGVSENDDTIVRKYINPETGRAVLVAEKNTQQADIQLAGNNITAPVTAEAQESLPQDVDDQDQSNNDDQAPQDGNYGDERGAVGGMPSNTDDDDEEDSDHPEDELPEFPDGNYLQPYVEGVPTIIRKNADQSFVKRIILITLYNGEANDIAPTVLRAKEYMDMFFVIPGRSPKPITTAFCINLSTVDNRALSIARTAFLLHRDADYADIRKWLGDLQPNLNLAVKGIAHPAALILNDEDICRFIAQHSREWYNNATHEERQDLAAIVDKHLTGVFPLTFFPGETEACVPLFKLIYLGDEHVPPKYKKLLKLQDRPTRLDEQGVHTDPTEVIPHMATYNAQTHARLKKQIRLHLATIIRVTGQPLNIIAQHFRYGEFLTYRARKPDEVDEQDPDNDIVLFDLDNAPWGELDAYGMALETYGNNWQADIIKENNITLAEELEIPITDYYTDSNRIYTTRFKRVSYKIRQWDPASRICDFMESVTGRLTPRRLCMQPEDMRIAQLECLTMNWDNEFEMAQHDELQWRGWNHPTRRKGEFIRRMTPDIARHMPIRVLPNGQTPYDVLVAYGDCTPLAFNKFTLHHGELVYQPGQRVSNPHNKSDFQFLEARDVFVAMGPLATIPQTAIFPGRMMMLKRCGLCKWVYGATIQCLPCKHLFCRVCLGLTQLVSVDRIVCLFCWRIPDKVRGKINPIQTYHPTHYNCSELAA